jgi:hypothetical protein
LATYLQDCLCFLHFVASVLQHALALAKAAAIVFALIPMLKCNYEHASNIKSSPKVVVPVCSRNYFIVLLNASSMTIPSFLSCATNHPTPNCSCEVPGRPAKPWSGAAPPRSSGWLSYLCFIYILYPFQVIVPHWLIHLSIYVWFVMFSYVFWHPFIATRRTLWLSFHPAGCLENSISPTWLLSQTIISGVTPWWRRFIYALVNCHITMENHHF